MKHWAFHLLVFHRDAGYSPKLFCLILQLVILYNFPSRILSVPFFCYTGLSQEIRAVPQVSFFSFQHTHCKKVVSTYSTPVCPNAHTVFVLGVCIGWSGILPGFQIMVLNIVALSFFPLWHGPVSKIFSQHNLSLQCWDFLFATFSPQGWSL